MRIFAFLIFAFCVTVPPATAQITKAPAQTTKRVIKLETIAKRLNHPWGLAFLPDGRLLVTERPGRMRIVSKDGKLSKPLRGVPAVYTSEQGGLLDVVLGPDFATSGMIYFSYAEPRGRGRSGTAVARGKLIMQDEGGRLEDLHIVFRQEPPNDSIGAFGSRILFMPDGSLFITLGDRDLRDQAQNPANHLGKLVRVLARRAPTPRKPKVRGLAARGLVDWSSQCSGSSTPPHERSSLDGRAWRARRRRDQRAASGTKLWLAGDYLRARLRQA